MTIRYLRKINVEGFLSYLPYNKFGETNLDKIGEYLFNKDERDFFY